MVDSKRNLRVATASDAPKSPKSILQAAEDGSQRELLVALRRRIAKTVNDEKCPPRDLASLSRRLLEIDAELRALDAGSGEGDLGQAGDIPDANFDSSAL